MLTPAKVHWTHALTAEGFALAPWRHQAYVARVLACRVEARTFTRGTLHGLIEYEPADDSLNVVALHNEERGNGDFVAAVEAFERIATTTGTTLRVVQFHNHRLAFWFERRPRWTCAHNRKFARYATFLPAMAQAIQHNNQ